MILKPYAIACSLLTISIVTTACAEKTDPKTQATPPQTTPKWLLLLFLEQAVLSHVGELKSLQ